MSRPEALNEQRQPVTHFYLDPAEIDGERCVFSREESHHITAVCRCEAGSTIKAADGRGRLFTVKIGDVRERIVSGNIESVSEDVNELRAEVAVAFSLLAMNRTEEVIDQLTQLGVRSIMPFLSEKSVIKLDSKRAGKKLKRWNRVALAAMKQSLRCRLPEIVAPVQLADLCARVSSYDMAIFGSLSGGSFPSASKISTADRILLISGPEGGFVEEEEKLLRGNSVLPVMLGERRLRAELAPIVLAARVTGHVS